MSLLETVYSPQGRYGYFSYGNVPVFAKAGLLYVSTELDRTRYGAFYPTASDREDMRTIANNQNITIDKVEVWLGHSDFSEMSSAQSRTFTIGATTRQYSDRSVITSVEALFPANVTGPAYNSTTGKWMQIDVAALRKMLEDENGILIEPNGDNVHYASTFAPGIRITYHYHNSELTLGASTGEFGGTVTSTLTTFLASYTHTIEYKLNNSAKTTVSLAAGTTSHTFTIPSNWMNQIPSATSATITVTLTTYDGSTVVGDLSTVNYIATVPASVVPSPGSITYTVSNPLAVPITNRGLTASLSGQAGVYGSTIRSYTLQGEGFTSVNQNLVIDPIQRIAGQSQSRTLAVTATVTDSRGRSASTTLNITAYEWDVPYFSALEYYRCNSYGTKSEDGTYLRIACTYACFPVTVGSTNKNSITAHTYKIVSKDGGTTIASGTLSGSAQVVGSGNLSADEEYYLQLTLTDGVTTIVYQHLIYSSAYVIHFRNGGTGVAFGQAADANNTVKINPNWVLIIGNNIDVGAKLANLESRIAALE